MCLTWIVTAVRERMVDGNMTKILVAKCIGNSILNIVVDFLDKSSGHKISYNF